MGASNAPSNQRRTGSLNGASGSTDAPFAGLLAAVKSGIWGSISDAISTQRCYGPRGGLTGTRLRGTDWTQRRNRGDALIRCVVSGRSGSGEQVAKPASRFIRSGIYGREFSVSHKKSVAFLLVAVLVLATASVAIGRHTKGIYRTKPPANRTTFLDFSFTATKTQAKRVRYSYRKSGGCSSGASAVGDEDGLHHSGGHDQRPG